MERSAVAVRAEELVARGQHPLRARFDAAVAHPRRVPDHHVEAALGHHVREVDVEREEVEVALFRPLEQLLLLGDALLQLAAELRIDRCAAAEEVALWRAGVSQLLFQMVDSARKKLRGQALIVTADDAVERRPLRVRRGAVTLEQVLLRAERDQPVGVDVGARVAEEVGRAEERIALEDVAIEVRQRLDVLDRVLPRRRCRLAAGDDRQPEAQLAQAHCLRLQVDAEE
jgi:hypothetical protein